MVKRFHVLAVTALVVLALGDIDAQSNTGAVPLATLLTRAGEYVTHFETSFSNVVSEERYEQNVFPKSRTYTGGPRVQHRELVSDFLLVRLPDPQGWVPFRDVFEVDKQAVRDREDRLMRLFLIPEATSAHRAAEITEESARYNIGVVRTVNHPLLAFQVVRPKEQYRFRFSNPKPDTSVGADVAMVEYAEQVKPSLIRGLADRDMPMHGRLWINTRTGSLAKTEVLVDSPSVYASIVTRYEADQEFGVSVPIEMHEEYNEPNGTRITGTAKYGRFRKFGVEVSDSLAKQAP